MRSCPYTLIFGTKESRVELGLNRTSAEENKIIFDYLNSHKEQIELVFGTKLDWLRLDEKKVSRIQFSKEYQGYDKDLWPEIIDWMITHMIKLEKATKQYLSQANSQIKNNS